MQHPRPIALAALLLLFTAVAARADDKPANAPAEIPHGSVTKYSFDQSRVFPGTVHDYWVYIPKQYDGSKPACVYVNQDGVQFNAPHVFDQLIAGGDMPVTIGIFVRPGVVPAANANALPRYNRSYEYDSVNDNYARFILDELLPHIVKTLHLNLSTNPNDRCIGGTSSGGIAAFAAAWERPGSFNRVYTGVGTFVGLRGGNEYPTLIRKTEPKPIRMFMSDGDHDLNIYGGDWWMANQTMERALTFAGYEVNHEWGTDTHSSRFATKLFPEGMKWIWKGWPAPIKAGLGSPQLQEILIPGQDWQLVADGYKFVEGPATNAKGEVYFDDVPDNKTYKIDLGGKVTLYQSDTHRCDGQRFGPDGMLYSCAGGAKQIVRRDPASGKVTVITDGFQGNDLVVNHEGGIYVTFPGWDGRSPSQIIYISPDGKKKIVDKGLRFTNGITLSPDQTLLYVDDTRSHWVYSYQVQPDGSLKYKQKYYHLHTPDNADDAGPDGMRVDTDGRLYVATRMGIQVCDQAGRVNCIIPTPNGRIANLCFGGPDHDIIYAMCGDRVYRRKVKTHGAMNYDKPIKPKAPHL